MIKEVITFHIKNNYFVEVSKTQNGCQAKFPKNILTSPKYNSSIIKYSIQDNLLVIKTDDDGVISKEIPKYATSLIILTDLMLKATERDISLRLIKIFDNLVLKEKLDDIIDIKLTKNERQKRDLLFDKFSDIVMGLLDGRAASNLGIFDAFSILVSLTDAGGF